MSESTHDRKGTEIRVIDNIPVFNLQYAFISLWESVPAEKFSDNSKRLFKELCNSLEYDYGGDPEDKIRRETLLRLNIVDEDTERNHKNDKLLKKINEKIESKRKKTDV